MKKNIDKIDDFPKANDVFKFTKTKDNKILKTELNKILGLIHDTANKKQYTISLEKISDKAKKFLVERGYNIRYGKYQGTKHNLYLSWKKE